MNLLRRSLLLLPFLVAACADAPPPAPPTPRFAPLAAGDDCTLATKLTPGVPGSPGHLIASPRNPNGASELSTLMRQMIDEMLAARADHEAGKALTPLFPTHRRIRCSWLTKPDDRTPAFDAMAQAYLASVQAFDAAPSPKAYNAVVTSCAACHSATCGGPVDYIESLRW